MTETFQDPKVGDTVALYEYMRELPGKAQIEKVTTSQLLVNGVRFRRKDGRQIGAGYGPAHVRPWTAELGAKIEAAKQREVNAARAKTIYARLSRAVEVVKFNERGGERHRSADDLGRLDAFVGDFETRAVEYVAGRIYKAAP